MARPFRERLKEASAYAGLEYSQSAIARSLGITRQSVDNWMRDGEPRPAMIFRIADTWGVDARWLATEEGNMIPPPSSGSGLTPQEHILVQRYRAAPPSWRNSLKVLMKLAVLLVVAVTVPREAEAATLHKSDSAAFFRYVPDLITHCARWIASLFRLHQDARIRLALG